MRIDLGQLAIQDLFLGLPAAPPETPARDVLVQSADTLRGVFTTDDAGWTIESLTCAQLLLARLHWQFGGLKLVTDKSATLHALKVQAKSGDDIDLSLEMAQLEALDLHVSVGTITLTAKLDAHALRLESREGVGLLTAEHAVFRSFKLVTTSGLSVSMPELVVTQLVLDWGGEDFRLEAGTAESHELTLTQAEATLRGQGLSVAAVRLLGSSVLVGQLRMGRLDVATNLEKSAPSESETSAPTGKPGMELDYAMLDGLTGRLDVDVAVDMAVPIIGRRRATHELRIPIDDGALNYRELESNLARLEDSLIDFSVRDGGLVLERGLPLISTRGRGKPILVWDLSPEDLALAEQHRVRLAVLPKFHMAGSSGQSEPPPPAKDKEESSLKLRHLSFENVDAALRLPQNPVALRGPINDLTFANLTLHGVVHHDPEGPERAGALHAALEGLRTSLRGLPLGEQQLSGRVEIAALHDMQVEFVDVRPSRVTAVAEGIALADFSLV